MHYLYWIGLAILFFGIEAASVGLITIWFAFGSIVAAVASALGAELWLQIVICVAVSVITLLFTRPYAMRLMNRDSAKTNTDRIIGKRALVIMRIDNTAGHGQVKVDGEVWSAISENNEILDIDQSVLVKEVKGVKLVVSPLPAQ